MTTGIIFETEVCWIESDIIGSDETLFTVDFKLTNSLAEASFTPDFSDVVFSRLVFVIRKVEAIVDATDLTDVSKNKITNSKMTEVLIKIC